MIHEPFTINYRLIDELFAYILWLLCIPEVAKFPKLAKFAKFGIGPKVRLRQGEYGGVVPRASAKLHGPAAA